jgi:urease accessory protein
LVKATGAGLQVSIPHLERAHGTARISFDRSRGRIRLADLAQSGSAKVMLPRSASDCPEAVFLNTAGGLTSGDRLQFGLDLGTDTRVTATTQTAERGYKCLNGPAHLTINATLGTGAHLDWLPQETILFENCHLIRDTHIALAHGASCVMSEIVVLGRRAMGESPTRARLFDRRMVTLGGRPLWADALRLDANVLADAGQAAILDGNFAFAVLAFLGAGAESAAAPLSNLPPTSGVQTAVSGWNGRCIARAMAPDLWILKQWLGRAIAQLTARPLPRVWQMQGVTL